MVNFIPVAPAEDGGLHGEVGDDGGEIGSGSIEKIRYVSYVTTDLNGETLEGLTRWDNYRIGHEESCYGTEKLRWSFVVFVLRYSCSGGGS